MRGFRNTIPKYPVPRKALEERFPSIGVKNSKIETMLRRVNDEQCQ